jgi:uncharacterized protein (DUF885 family)
MSTRKPAALLVLLLLLFRPVPAGADPGSGLPPAMARALAVLRAKPSAATGDRLLRARLELLEVPGEEIDDDTWIDLHLLLMEIDRRLAPQPAPPPEGGGIAFRPDSIPRTLTEAERNGAGALVDLACRLVAACPETDRRLPDSDDRTALAEGAARARALRTVATGVGGDDPLLRAAALALSEIAADLAFDLEVLAKGLVPEGRERFAWLLARRQRLSFAPEEAAVLGREAVADCLAQLQAEARRQAPGKTWQALVLAQMDDHPASEEELLAYCREVIRVAEARIRESGLVTIPEFAAQPRVFVGKPGFPAPYACYLPGGEPVKGRYGGRVMITAFEQDVRPGELQAVLRDRSHAWLEMICPHEAVPGHHLQFAVASRIKRPCRGYGYNSAYVEGWGLYSEELMRRAGYYQTPAARLAFLRMRLWRAVRIVVDTGLHTGGMRPSAAVRMLTDVVLMERSAALAEVTRYLTSPTQPLSYLIGCRKIRAMRDAFVARHGSSAEREFHDRFLALGPIPLDLAAAALLQKRKAYDAAHGR